MTINGLRAFMLAFTAALAVTLLGGCVPAAREIRQVAPAVCADSTLLSLKQQHPDSLSGREWQRLQILDRQCADALMAASNRASSHGWWLGSGLGAGLGIMTAVMVAMMVTMW